MVVVVFGHDVSMFVRSEMSGTGDAGGLLMQAGVLFMASRVLLSIRDINVIEMIPFALCIDVDFALKRLHRIKCDIRCV